MIDQRGRRALGDHRAGAQHGDAVGQAQRLHHVVGDHQRGEPQLVVQRPVVLAQGVARQRVEGGERLVHQHGVGAGGQRPGDADALALAARELVRQARAIAGVEAHEAEQLVHPRGHARLVPAEQPRRDGDVLRHRHVREQADLLEHVADAPAQGDRVEAAPHRRRRCGRCRRSDRPGG